jgi:hypothetical protein
MSNFQSHKFRELARRRNAGEDWDTALAQVFGYSKSDNLANGEKKTSKSDSINESVEDEFNFLLQVHHYAKSLNTTYDFDSYGGYAFVYEDIFGTIIILSHYRGEDVRWHNTGNGNVAYDLKKLHRPCVITPSAQDYFNKNDLSEYGKFTNYELDDVSREMQVFPHTNLDSCVSSLVGMMPKGSKVRGYWTYRNSEITCPRTSDSESNHKGIYLRIMFKPNLK